MLLAAGRLGGKTVELDRYDMKFATNFRSGLAQSGNTAVVMDYDLESPTGFSMSALIGGAHLLLAPFPWQLGGGSTRLLLTLPEQIAWWWLFVFRVIPGA